MGLSWLELNGSVGHALAQLPKLLACSCEPFGGDLQMIINGMVAGDLFKFSRQVLFYQARACLLGLTRG